MQSPTSWDAMPLPQAPSHQGFLLSQTQLSRASPLSSHMHTFYQGFQFSPQSHFFLCSQFFSHQPPSSSASSLTLSHSPAPWGFPAWAKPIPCPCWYYLQPLLMYYLLGTKDPSQATAHPGQWLPVMKCLIQGCHSSQEWGCSTSSLSHKTKT